MMATQSGLLAPVSDIRGKRQAAVAALLKGLHNGWVRLILLGAIGYFFKDLQKAGQKAVDVVKNAIKKRIEWEQHKHNLVLRLALLNRHVLSFQQVLSCKSRETSPVSPRRSRSPRNSPLGVIAESPEVDQKMQIEGEFFLPISMTDEPTGATAY